MGLGTVWGISGAAVGRGTAESVDRKSTGKRIRSCYFCDEPTGALDYNTGKSILKLLQDTCRNSGMTVILITHNSAIAPMADRDQD